MTKSTKVWLAYTGKYGYINLNRNTKALLKQCEEVNGMYFCYFKSVENKLINYVNYYLNFGEIDRVEFP